jgi:hypothetical protein
VRAFFCDCGNRVFFDNIACLACGRRLGFDPGHLRMVTLSEDAEGQFSSADGRRFRLCANAVAHDNCNWLVDPADSASLCRSCRLTAVIPALERPGNLRLWTRLEQAKRRLLYSLFRLGLPLSGRAGQSGLAFRFMEDRRRNPAVLEQFVSTAHHDGTITINIAEADDVARHAVREQMQERYRTVLGHLRHESGHFYFSGLVTGPADLDACRALFGDEREDYESALHGYYDHGAPVDWPERFVSAYAAAHPAEDFAETFAHYLHIDDALETAHAAGLAPHSGAGRDNWIEDWINLAITLNEILRSLGADDPYPFVLTGPVREKLRFIDRLVRRPAVPAGG